MRAAAARAGGVHAAGGTLGDGFDNPILATLRVVLLSAGLPDDFRAARVAFWRADEGILDSVRERLGSAFEPAIRNFVLTRTFHEAVLSERPDLGDSPRDLADRLKANFPQPAEITVADLSSMIRRALLLNRKELPLTLIVLDETQEFLRNDPDRTGTVRSNLGAPRGRFRWSLAARLHRATSPDRRGQFAKAVGSLPGARQPRRG